MVQHLAEQCPCQRCSLHKVDGANRSSIYTSNGITFCQRYSKQEKSSLTLQELIWTGSPVWQVDLLHMRISNYSILQKTPLLTLTIGQQWIYWVVREALPHLVLQPVIKEVKTQKWYLDLTYICWKWSIIWGPVMLYMQILDTAASKPVVIMMLLKINNIYF